MRSIKELLELMLENKKLFERGLCRWSSNLLNDNIMSDDEYISLRQYINRNHPKNDFIDKVFRVCRKNDLYYWTAGLLYPRVRWIKEHIKKLEDGTAI